MIKATKRKQGNSLRGKRHPNMDVAEIETQCANSGLQAASIVSALGLSYKKLHISLKNKWSVGLSFAEK